MIAHACETCGATAVWTSIADYAPCPTCGGLSFVRVGAGAEPRSDEEEHAETGDGAAG